MKVCKKYTISLAEVPEGECKYCYGTTVTLPSNGSINIAMVSCGICKKTLAIRETLEANIKD